MGFETLDANKKWQVDQSPGLNLEVESLEGFRDLLLRTLSREGYCAPAIEPRALAETYRFDAEAGDPRALVIATVLEGLDVALRDDDPAVAGKYLTLAFDTLLKQRPTRVPLGAGDARIKRSGRRSTSAYALLECAAEVISRLPPPLDDPYVPRGAVDLVGDKYIDQAEQLAWRIEWLFPAIYRRKVAERKSAILALARHLRFAERDPEGVAKAALRAFGFSEKKASNVFSFRAKARARSAKALATKP